MGQPGQPQKHISKRLSHLKPLPNKQWDDQDNQDNLF